MKIQLLMIVLITFLFNGCKEDPKPEPEVVLVNKEQPKLKNLKRVDIDVPAFSLYKEEYNSSKEYTNIYVVDKAQLAIASKNTQALRYKNHLQEKQINFYIWQNNKFNALNKKPAN